MSNPNDESQSNATDPSDSATAVRRGPPIRVSNAPRARFAMMNASSATSAAQASTGAVSKPKPAPSDQPTVVKKKKVDPLKDKYRDRAEERRQRAPEAPEEDDAPVDAEALRERRELSKYLGGSEETTHLVEGLDIMLYERRKLEIEMEEKKRREAAANAPEGTLVGAKQLVIDQYGHAKAVEVPQQFETSLGRGVYNTLFRREQRPALETFLPGRTTYVFTVDYDSPRELPTIIERSMLSDAEERDARDVRSERFSANTSDHAMQQLAVVMSYLKQGEKGLKKRRKELEDRETRTKEVVKDTLKKLMAGTAPKPAPVATVFNEDEEDIFGDVADKEYIPTTTATAKTVEKSREQTIKETWDAVRGDDGDGRKHGDATAKRGREEMTSKRKDDAMQTDAVDDDYDGFESASDEEDMFAMDTGVRLKRGDFATDAEWEKYAATREAIPKRAFNFGVKAADVSRKGALGKSDKKKIYQAMYKSVTGTLGSSSGTADS